MKVHQSRYQKEEDKYFGLRVIRPLIQLLFE